jgi:hypothetical protein
MSLKQIGESIWVQHFPFEVLGAPLGKTMTVMRLPEGELVIHSGAPLTKTDVRAVRALGEPTWLLEGSRMHDTFAGRLRQAFPEATYLLPPRFPLESQDLAPARRLKTAELPAAWRDEIEIVRVAGIPAIEEHVLWHRRSKTLVVSDLVFNLEWSPGQRMPWFLRWVSGIKSFPATSRLVKLATKDRDAARKSIERILEWEIARVVVGHGAVMETNARDLLKQTLNWLITDQV